MKIPEMWKGKISEEEIKKEEENLKGKNIGVDIPSAGTIKLSPEEILDNIAKEAEKQYPAYKTEKRFIEENKILGKEAEESQIGKIQKLKEEGKTDEVEKLIQNS